MQFGAIKPTQLVNLADYTAENPRLLPKNHSFYKLSLDFLTDYSKV